MAGRPRGSTNKTTTAAKEAFQMAFNKLGGVDQLTKWAQKNPTDFYKIYGKLIPIDIDVTRRLINVSIGLYPESEVIEHNEQPEPVIAQEAMAGIH